MSPPASEGTDRERAPQCSGPRPTSSTPRDASATVDTSMDAAPTPLAMDPALTNALTAAQPRSGDAFRIIVRAQRRRRLMPAVAVVVVAIFNVQAMAADPSWIFGGAGIIALILLLFFAAVWWSQYRISRMLARNGRMTTARLEKGLVAGTRYVRYYLFFSDPEIGGLIAQWLPHRWWFLRRVFDSYTTAIVLFHPRRSLAFAWVAGHTGTAYPRQTPPPETSPQNTSA